MEQRTGSLAAGMEVLRGPGVGRLVHDGVGVVQRAQEPRQPDGHLIVAALQLTRVGDGSFSEIDEFLQRRSQPHHPQLHLRLLHVVGFVLFLAA